MWSQLPTDSNDLKAVMVWIHGGIFITGSGTSVLFGPDHLLTEDIVFVSINYRLGVLGISYSRYVRLCYVRWKNTSAQSSSWQRLQTFVSVVHILRSTGHRAGCGYCPRHLCWRLQKYGWEGGRLMWLALRSSHQFHRPKYYFSLERTAYAECYYGNYIKSSTTVTR